MKPVSVPTYACIYVPEFPAQALLRLRPHLGNQPLGVLDGERPFDTICSQNKQAARLGMTPGMPRAEAELFGIVLVQRSLVEEESARSALLHCLGAFTPAIEPVHKNACAYVLDLTGTTKLLGPLATAVETISARIGELKFSARITTGSNFHAVAAMAPVQRCRITHIPFGEERQALAPLPVSVLPLRAEHAELFANWGVTSLGDLAALPEVELIARMGQEGKRLRALARGEHTHYFHAIADPRSFEEYLEFDSPVESLDSLLFALNVMLDQLLVRVRAHACALASVTLQCDVEGRPVHCREVRPAMPTEDRQVLLKLLQLDLEAHASAGGILGLRLTGETGPVSKVQIGLFSPQLPEPMRLEVTMARIHAIVGQQRAGRAMLTDTHTSDAFSIRKFTAAPAGCVQSTRQARPRVTHTLRRFRPPQTVLVEQRARGIRVFWHNAVRYTIERLYGPWRGSGCWWSDQAWASTRWDFAAHADDGALIVGVLLVDQASKDWMLEGVYD